MNIVFVHGAWATKDSFNYMSQFVSDEHSKYFFEYDCQISNFADITHNLFMFVIENIGKNKPVIFVGHSLGGLISIYTAKKYFEKDCFGVMTISSPMKGIYLNPIIRPYMEMRAPILGEISPSRSIITETNRNTYDFPILSILTVTKFSPMHIGESDGVLSLTAQKWKPKTKEYKEIKLKNSHNEVLLSNNFKKIMMFGLGKEKLELQKIGDLS